MTDLEYASIAFVDQSKANWLPDDRATNNWHRTSAPRNRSRLRLEALHAQSQLKRCCIGLESDAACHGPARPRRFRRLLPRYSDGIPGSKILSFENTDIFRTWSSPRNLRARRWNS